MPRFVSSIHLLEMGRNVGEREEELGVNGPEEVLTALRRLFAEIEVIEEVRNPSIVRILLEVINSVRASEMDCKLKRRLICIQDSPEDTLSISSCTPRVRIGYEKVKCESYGYP